MKKRILALTILTAYIAYTHAADVSPSLHSNKQKAQLSEVNMLALAIDIDQSESSSRLRKYIHTLGTDRACQLLKGADQHQQKNIVASCAKMLATQLHAIQEFDTLPEHLQKAVLLPQLNTTLKKLYGARQEGPELMLKTDDVVWVAEHTDDSILARTTHKVWQRSKEEEFKIIYHSPDTHIISAHSSNNPDKLLIGSKKNISEYDVVTKEHKIVYDPGDQDIQEVNYNKEQNKLLLITGTGWAFNRENIILVDLLTNQSQHIYKTRLDINSVRPNKDWSKLVISDASVIPGSIINDVNIKDLENNTLQHVYAKKSYLPNAMATDDDIDRLFITRECDSKGPIVHDIQIGEDVPLITPYDNNNIRPLQSNHDGSELLVNRYNKLMTYDITDNEIKTIYCLPDNRDILSARYDQTGHKAQVISRSSTFIKLYITSLLLSPFLAQLELADLQQLRLLLKASASWKEQKPYTIITEDEFYLYQSLDKAFQNDKFFLVEEIIENSASYPIT